MHYKYTEFNHIIRTVYRKSRHVAPHLHSALEMVYVTDGSLILGMGQDMFEMEKGDLGIIFPDVIHHYQVFGEGVNKACYIQVTPSGTGPFSEELQKCALENPVLKHKDISEEVIYALKAMMNITKGEEIIAEAYTQIILAKCLPKMNLVEKASVGSSDLIYQTVAYLSANFKDPITLDKMAMDLGVSKYVLSRVFSGTFHRNFNQYLNDIRLNYAVTYLENTSESVLDICLDSGFESQRTFNRVFKDRFHVSPSEYRKRQIENR